VEHLEALLGRGLRSKATGIRGGREPRSSVIYRKEGENNISDGFLSQGRAKNKAEKVKLKEGREGGDGCRGRGEKEGSTGGGGGGGGGKGGLITEKKWRTQQPPRRIETS